MKIGVKKNQCSGLTQLHQLHRRGPAATAGCHAVPPHAGADLTVPSHLKSGRVVPSSSYSSVIAMGESVIKIVPISTERAQRHIRS
jgi:hypothetical protein